MLRRGYSDVRACMDDHLHALRGLVSDIHWFSLFVL